MSIRKTIAELRGAVGGQKKRKRRVMRHLTRLVNYDLFDSMQWKQPEAEHHIAASVPLPTVEALSELVNVPSVATSIQPEQVELPSIEELDRLFDLYNTIHFNGELPKASIEYSKRMLAAGSCEPVGRRIKIGVRYHQIFREELEDTLKHEMIHLIHFHHDRRFKAKASELGVPVHAKFHPTLKREPRFLYQCPACKMQYPRQKRLRETSCGSCSKGSFDRRFKLQFVSK